MYAHVARNFSKKNRRGINSTTPSYSYHSQAPKRKSKKLKPAQGNKLVYNYAQLDDVDAHEYAYALSKYGYYYDDVDHVNLGFNKIGDDGATSIAQALITKQQNLQLVAIKILHMQENKIGPRGAVKLSQALQLNCGLEELNLHGNQIDDEGAWALATALKNNTSLKRLFLGANSISDTGAMHLAEAIKCNSILETLYLGLNDIGNLGAEKLSEAISFHDGNGSLKTLYLEGNNFITNQSILRDIAESLEQNIPPVGSSTSMETAAYTQPSVPFVPEYQPIAPVAHALPSTPPVSEAVMVMDAQVVTSNEVTVNNNNSETEPKRLGDPIFPDAVLSEEDEDAFPLHAAVKYGDKELLEREMNENVGNLDEVLMKTDSKCRTAMDLAALTGQSELVAILRGRGGKYKYHGTAKMRAIMRSREHRSKEYLTNTLNAAML